jgi:hypothetical protein
MSLRVTDLWFETLPETCRITKIGLGVPQVACVSELLTVRKYNNWCSPYKIRVQKCGISLAFPLAEGISQRPLTEKTRTQSQVGPFCGMWWTSWHFNRFLLDYVHFPIWLTSQQCTMQNIYRCTLALQVAVFRNGNEFYLLNYAVFFRLMLGFVCIF